MTDASAPGKLVLVGEYAVLEGAPAITAAVDVRARARVVAIPGAESVFFDALSGQAFYFAMDSSGPRWIGDHPGANGAILEAVIASCTECSTLLDDGPSFRVSMNTDDFFTRIGGSWTKLGVGSSAAVLVALVGALVTELNLAMSPEELLAVSHTAHRRFQGGLGSGADVATAVHGGVVTVRRSADPEQVAATHCNWPSGLLAVPIWSGVSASTTALLSRFEQFKGTQPDEYRRHIRRLKALSEQACVAWPDQSVGDVLSALESYDDALRAFDHDAKIGINTKVHDRIRQLVERQGAIYKTSGAGGGDFGLALTDSADVLEAVRGACREGGYALLDKSFAAEGLVIE